MKLSNKEKIDCKIQYYIWQRWKQVPQNLVQIYSMKKKVVEYPISDDNPKKAFTVSSDNRQSDDHRFDLLSLQFHCLNSLQKKLMQNRKKKCFLKVAWHSKAYRYYSLCWLIYASAYWNKRNNYFHILCDSKIPNRNVMFSSGS